MGEVRRTDPALCRWNAFVVVNPDPGCEPLPDFLCELPTFFARWPLGDRYTGCTSPKRCA